jgi:hypothetical protein
VGRRFCYSVKTVLRTEDVIIILLQMSGLTRIDLGLRAQNSINNNFIGGIDVTIGVKVNQVLASLESATAELKTFALDTQDKNAQKMFSDYSKQLEEIKNGIKGRVNYLEQQEPQYKVFEQQEQ